MWALFENEMRNIFLYIRCAYDKFPEFFRMGVQNCRRLWKIQYVIAIHLMRWLTNFYDFSFNEQLQHELEYTLLKPDCYSWWISKMHPDTLEERYAIKFGFKLRKNATETYRSFRLLLENLAWIEHQFLSGIRESRKAGSLWGMMRGVGGVRKSIHLSWLAKRLGLGLLCWGFKGVKQEIPREEASTLQNRLSGISSRIMHQSTTASLSQTIWPRWASRQFQSLPRV